MTYLYKTVQSNELFRDLKAMGRDNFSYEGARALMEYIIEIAESGDTPIEYDPIALCCDFAEYQESEYHQLASEYDDAPQADDFECPYEWGSALIEWLRDQTTVIEFDDGIIIQSF